MNFRSTLLVIAILLGVAITINVNAGSPTIDQDEQLKRGAQLYDNWPKLAGIKPEGNHPLYPVEGKKQGAASWRCKECHGWDYIGKDGRYAKGSHFTGIDGTLDQLGRDTVELKQALTNDAGQHDFSTHLSPDDIDALALFLRSGQTDTSQVIDTDGQGTGDTAMGAPLFAENCAACHGDDGNALDFKSEKDGVQGVGWLANDNPQETWHKILWGHPGSHMPAMRTEGGLTLEQAKNLLTFSQTLD